MGQHLSPWYNHEILVSGYLVLTAVNWQQHGCALSGHCRLPHWLESVTFHIGCPVVWMDGGMYGHETTKISWMERPNFLIYGAPLACPPCMWGSRTVTRCGYFIDFTGFQSTFCRGKGSFHTQRMYLHSILLSFFLFLVAGNSFKGTHNWGETMFSSWLYILQDIDQIFSNITDIYEFSVTFLGLLDAAIEVADEGKQPAIGECFEEMAEVTCVYDPIFA